MLWGGNGKPLATSPQAYSSEQVLLKALDTVRRNWSSVKVVAKVR